MEETRGSFRWRWKGIKGHGAKEERGDRGKKEDAGGGGGGRPEGRLTADVNA